MEGVHDFEKGSYLVFDKNSIIKGSDLISKGEDMSMVATPFAWGIKETNEPGILTIQSAEYKEKNHQWKWVLESHEIIHGANGWEFISSEQPRKPILSNLAEDLVIFLQRNAKKFPIKNVFNPNEEEKAKFYSHVTAQSLEAKEFKEPKSLGFFEKEFNKSEIEENKVSLPEKLEEILRCPYTNKIMKTPMTLTKGKQQGLTCDASGLDSVLKELNKKSKDHYTKADFIENHTLGSIIKSKDLIAENIQKNNWDEVEKFILDPIHLEPMKNAVLNPAGQSYSKKTLEEYLSKKLIEDFVSRKPFGKILSKEDLIPNKPLQNFIETYGKLRQEAEKKLAKKRSEPPSLSRKNS